MNIQQLEPVTIAKGSSFNGGFIFENADKSIPDYSSYEGYYILSQYGFEDENVLSIKMSHDENNIFTVSINNIELEAGTYTAKIVLVDDDGYQYKYARGIFNILKDTSEIKTTI